MAEQDKRRTTTRRRGEVRHRSASPTRLICLLTDVIGH